VLWSKDYRILHNIAKVHIWDEIRELFLRNMETESKFQAKNSRVGMIIATIPYEIKLSANG
jgi:hypothetical protein